MGILCTEELPTKEQLTAFTMFIQRQEGTFHKLVVAVREGKQERSLSTFFDTELEYRFQEELLGSLIQPSTNTYQREMEDYFFKRQLENSETSLSQIYVPVGGQIMKVEKEKMIEDEVIGSSRSLHPAMAQ